jgi:hypothetical protein
MNQPANEQSSRDARVTPNFKRALGHERFSLELLKKMGAGKLKELADEISVFVSIIYICCIKCFSAHQKSSKQ